MLALHPRLHGGGGDGGATGAESRDCYLKMYAEKKPDKVDPNEQTHIVQSGDSVYKIASTYGITPEALVNYNYWTEGINHPLFQGDQVKIPPGSQVPSATPDSGGGDTGGPGIVPDANGRRTPAGLH